MSKRNQTGQLGVSAPGPERPGRLSLVAGGLIYAGALLGMWILLAGQPDVQDLVVGSAAAVLAAPRALSSVPVDVGTDVRAWPAARREAVLTALMSAAPNTIVVDIDMEAGTALVHQLAGAPEPDAHPAAPG